MKLTHLNLDQLKPSPLNVRTKGGKDVSNLLPSIRRLGILQPLLVRPSGDGFEVVAGERRYRAALKLAEEGIAEPVPVAVMGEGDDAEAIEASLVENTARLPMDEIDQYKAFAALRGEGLEIGDIASRFGVTERLVGQRLAIAGIIEPILNAYRREEIDPGTLRILTMATLKQQKAWWALHKGEDGYAPTGSSLKNWLFGGAQIALSNALFDIAAYEGAIVSNLFGEDRYFANADDFWPLQNAAIAERRDRYAEAGWNVTVLDIGERFCSWEHTKTPKSKGGRVFIEVAANGEVAFHEGWLTAKEARRQEKADRLADGSEAETTPERSELTNPMHNYLGLHRHAAVRTELLASPAIALRLVVAHMLAGSNLWSVRPERQRANSETIAQSLGASPATAGFDEEGARIAALLGITGEMDSDALFCLPRDYAFAVLQTLDDKDVLRVLTFVMASTLEAHTSTVEMLGQQFGTDMRDWWKADQTFFDLMRDKQAINAMLGEVAGDMTANAHVTSTGKVQKKIIADCLTGNGRDKVEGWLPRYMAFPQAMYLAESADIGCEETESFAA